MSEAQGHPCTREATCTLSHLYQLLSDLDSVDCMYKDQSTTFTKNGRPGFLYKHVITLDTCDLV